MKHFICIICIISFIMMSCNRHSETWSMMNTAECLMETKPDSSFYLLRCIDKENLIGKEEHARYALLMSMALDKNYIDTTTFDILQPAIDYYLKKGTSDEKIRTYYYQGRIYQNQNNYDCAMNSFIHGLDVADIASDSLILARMLVAQSVIFKSIYNIESYSQNRLIAADIYRSFGYNTHYNDCLLSAMDGFMLMDNKTMSDSLMSLCETALSDGTLSYNDYRPYHISYVAKYGSPEQIKDLLEIYSQNNTLSIEEQLNMAYAYNEIGNPLKSKNILDNIYESGIVFNELKFTAISVSVYEKLCNYKMAFEYYQSFSGILADINNDLFKNKVQSSEERHKIEMKAQKESKSKMEIIWCCLAGIILLINGIIILILIIRTNILKRNELKAVNEKLEMEKMLAEQKARIIESEKDNLHLENINLQLEQKKKILEAENLIYRISELESEAENLKKILDSKDELPLEVQSAIQERVEVLNSLLAEEISENSQYGRPYEKWIQNVFEDKQRVMNNNRLSFKASHPKFIQYFEDLNLTEKEINYVCLYAIGLKGKEVGAYMQLKSHVNMSSAIRKKLGIDKYETNIGIYVRNLLTTYKHKQ